MPLFFVPPYQGAVHPIQIDGQFNDWSSVATEPMAAGGLSNPNGDVIRFGIEPNLGPVAFYVELAGAALAGGGRALGAGAAFQGFVDSGGAASWGYALCGSGAVWVLVLSGS